MSGDVVGRSGLESGAEDLLRGTPGWTLVAVDADGGETVLYETEMVPGADVAITLRPDIQAAAQDALAPYGEAATAVIDPRNGDVWALASQPAFNPNSMTLGTTLGGVPLAPAGQGQIFNKAVLGAYPAGSSFKPFTLVAALATGVVTPASTRTCPPTWQYGDFTFRNYMDHSLPGQVGPGRVDGLQLQHDLHAARLRGLPAPGDGADRPAQGLRLRRADRHRLPRGGDRHRAG